MCGFHCGQVVRSREQLMASMCRREAPKRTGMPGRRAEKGNAPAGAERCRPLGIRGESLALSERMNSPGKRILAAAAKTLWTQPRCGVPAAASAIHWLYALALTLASPVRAVNVSIAIFLCRRRLRLGDEDGQEFPNGEEDQPVDEHGNESRPFKRLVLVQRRRAHQIAERV